ncbi:MAG: aldehyde dehydrogenase [Coxiellaceae bacterium]|nr:aldehyde dehydrogenase [Coxiellaceae bacterium]
MKSKNLFMDGANIAPTIKTYDLYINGEWQPPHSGEWIASENPYNNQVWCTIPRANASDVDKACDAAHEAFKSWSQTPAKQRRELLCRLADLIEEKAEHLAEIEVRDNGKLYGEMHGQCQYAPEFFRYYASLAEQYCGKAVTLDKPEVYGSIYHEPLGVVAAITAWNSPLLLTTWKCAPALAAGNTVVLKPSEYTSASALELAVLFEQAGFPPGVFNVVTGYGIEAGAALIEHPKVAKVAFTGGTATGKHIYQTAAKDLKHVTLELGGKSANIVFTDANIDNAVKGVVSGIFAANGQTCIAGSRALVEATIYDEFIERLVAFIKKAKFGDPMDPATNFGPIANPPQYEKILEYIAIGKQDGARCVYGGNPVPHPEGIEPSWFIQPTIFADVANDMRIAREEVFGSVLSVIKFDGEEEALQIANDSPYGLAAGLWTSDAARIERMPHLLQAGTVWVNTYRCISYLMPFGGYKASGIGREGGEEALFNYLQSKSVMISAAKEVANPFVMK